MDKGRVSRLVAINPKKIPPIMATRRSAGILSIRLRAYPSGLVVNTGVSINPTRKPNRPKVST
jgi:hypothetical protein